MWRSTLSHYSATSIRVVFRDLWWYYENLYLRTPLGSAANAPLETVAEDVILTKKGETTLRRATES